MNALANSELALAFLISCWAKATVLLAGAWFMVFALRQRSSAAQRHHLWAAVMLASLALPFFSLLLPTWHSATLGSAAALWIPARANATSAGSEAIPFVIITAASGSAIFNKLAGAALTSFVKKCCNDQATAQKLHGAAQTSFTKKCVSDATGM